VEKEDTSIVVNLTHPSNVPSEIELRFSGKRTDVNDEHRLKTPAPRVVMFDGSIIEVNDEHLPKA